MYRALAFKEWRELWWTGAVAFMALGATVWNEIGPTVDFETFAITRHDINQIPFRSDDMAVAVTGVSFCLAIVLGLGQTLGESVRGTWRYLRQRPIPFSRLLLTKLTAGLGILLVSTGLPFGVYLTWAASEGWHSSPFEWELAEPTFFGWTGATAIYLAAFLVGIRKARWYGSWLWPFAPAIVLYFYFGQFGTSGYPVGTVTLVVAAVTLGAIFYAASERDD